MPSIAAHETPNILRTLSLEALEVCRGEIGNGEIGGNNRGPHVERYRGGKRGNAPWCAALQYFALEQAANRLGCKPPFERTHLAKGFGDRAAKMGRWLRSDEQPQRGDWIVWHRGKRLTRKGHIGIVADYKADSDQLRTIEGNVGLPPASVQVFTYRAGLWRQKLYGVARLWG